ncbi:MAG: phenylalanine--tRNA ligase subunit alpha [Candidatus Aenigmarchaeota archaeon]|nr:phenylalanine--tRNA ligase subunit alpha [Candidatus Aenigmarchaeota archaeon]
MDLHPHELKLLGTLKNFHKGADIAALSKASGLNPDSVRKAALWAAAKGLVKSEVTETKSYLLEEEGIRYLKLNTLPELIIFNEVLKKPADINYLKNLREFQIGMMWGQKKGLIFNWGSDNVRLAPKKEAEQKIAKDLEALDEVGRGNYNIDRAKLEEFLRRRFLKEKIEKTETLSITKKGLELADSNPDGGIGKLTPEIIKSGAWKKGVRPYDVSLPSAKLIAGKKHITSVWAEKIRKIFLDMGFSEASGPLVESSFWCFDALYQPQDHPSRELADTFYMKKPGGSKLPEPGIVKAVKNAHESGTEGSTGWMYKWSEDIAKKPVLRTHTTAVSARSLFGLTPPAKIFCIGRAFRNETVDYKHLPEFTQVEGIVVDENVTFRDLLGYLKEFYWRLGFEKIRFRPAYFPYTEMSVEPEVYFEEKGEWVELGGSGIFRPEVTKPLGVDVPVLAWGLSLERPIALMTGLNDIRNFYFKNDLKLLRNAKVNV